MTGRGRPSRSEDISVNANMAKNTNLIGLVGNFDGEEDGNTCKFFFEQFDQIAEMAKWTNTEKVTILKSRFRGKALRFLITDENLTKARNYNELKHAFLEYFNEEINISNKQLQFNNIKQREGEPVRDLAQRIVIASNNYLGTSANSMNEETKIMLDKLRLAKFVNALEPPLQSDVLKANPDNFNEAIRIATNSQNALKTMATIKINNLMTDTQGYLTRPTQERDDIETLRQEINHLKTERFAQPSQQQNCFCHLCGETNSHYTAQCNVYRDLQGFRQIQNRQQMEPPNQWRPNYFRGNVNRRWQNRGRQFANNQRPAETETPHNHGDRQAQQTSQANEGSAVSFLDPNGRSNETR